MSRRVNLPHHRNPGLGSRATSPYNFVPLPEVVIPAVTKATNLPCHDTYVNPNYPHTGYFEVKLTTRSLLYIRGGLSTTRPNENDLSEFEKAEAEKAGQTPSSFRQAMKNKSDFFHTLDPKRPIIPGSSLRGMLRNLLEVVSYGKVQWVTDKQLFFRTVDDSAIGVYYNGRMVEPLGNVQVGSGPSAPGYRSRVRGGFWRLQPDGSYVIEECIVARIETERVLSIFGLHNRSELYELDGHPLATVEAQRNPNQTPRWSYQHQMIQVDMEKNEQDHFFPAQYRQNGRLRHRDLYLRFRRATGPTNPLDPQKARVNGTLILTGHMNDKHLAFVFVKAKTPRTFAIPNDPGEEDPNKRLVDRFHDDDQLTRWQKLAFPNGQPAGTRREHPGYLRDGEPVFFLVENGQLTFFGRAQMFRLPYRQRPLDLVPLELRRPEEIDFAEALFGFVRTRQELEEMKQRGVPEPEQGSPGRAYAGRVFVTNAILDDGQTDVLSPSIVEPKILATPKPTAFQLYLTQQEPNDRKKLGHYDSPPPHETVIRGHKFYWLKGQRTIEQVRERDPNWLREDGRVKDNSTQHTQFQPVNPGKYFTFRIYFENLSDVELGALQWILTLPGEVNIEHCHSLGMGKPLGMGAVKLEPVLYLTGRQKRYENLFTGEAWCTGTESSQLDQDPRLEFEKYVLRHLSTKVKRLCDVERIRMLLRVLEWREPPTHLADKQYATLEDFRRRPVLPDPLSVG